MSGKSENQHLIGTNTISTNIWIIEELWYNGVSNDDKYRIENYLIVYRDYLPVLGTDIVDES